MLGGNLASQRRPRGGELRERSDEENESISWRDREVLCGLFCQEKRQDGGGISGAIRVHPTQITDWRQQLRARVADVLGGSKPSARI